MFKNNIDFQKDLLNHHVYTAWQFIEYVQSNIYTVEFCIDIINKINEKLTQKTMRWQHDLFSNFVEETTEEGKKIRKISMTTENSPVYEVKVAGENVNPWFLFEKLLRDFYQYSMNSFDAISQVANSGLLGNRGKKVDSVDFQRMISCFAQKTYSETFPKTAQWFASIASSPKFQYIEAINNRTKHTADISNRIAMGIFGSANSAHIGPFFRKEEQHEKKELFDQLQASLDFLKKAWNDFLSAFCEEYVLDKFVENRIHEIGGVYQQRLKNEPEQDLSYAFICQVGEFTSMPNEMYVLLAYFKDEVISHESPFNHILVCDEDGNNVVGRYVAVDPIGDDCLLHYRKYIKDEKIVGPMCMIYEKKDGATFYHNNPFFTITVVSDDDIFLGRSSLPF